MWSIRNETAYAADRTWVRDPNGRHHWLVVVKATFSFDAKGTLTLGDEQLPPLAVPEYFGDPAHSSLRYDADLIGPKPGTDVIVNGQAHAPGARPTREVVVGLAIGSLQKTLLVRGPSHYVYGATGLRVSEPEPFLTRPIRYEHAYGGSDLSGDEPRRHRHDIRNPVGVGVAQRETDLHGRPAPTIFHPRGDPAKLGPAGFGPIASHWSPRRELAGTYDRRWFETKRPLLPDDYDSAHTMCSPLDQRTPTRLQGHEGITLLNLSATGTLSLLLPRIAFRASTQISRRTVEHAFELSTVVIEPDEQRMIMVWQSSLEVRTPEVDLLVESRVREVSA
jgi:hypothetical protein